MGKRVLAAFNFFHKPLFGYPVKGAEDFISVIFIVFGLVSVILGMIVVIVMATKWYSLVVFGFAAFCAWLVKLAYNEMKRAEESERRD